MDIRDFDVAKKLIDEIETEQFQDRRRAEYKSYKVAEGGQRDYILERLQELFPKSWSAMRVSDISVSNKILSKISKAYKDSPIRDYGEQTDSLAEMLDDADFDSTMSEFDRDFNRQRYGLLWVNKIDEKPMFHSIKGFVGFVKRNEQSGKIEAVVLNYPDTEITHNANSNADGIEQNLSENQDDSSAEVKKFAMWTKDFHAVWKMSRNNKTASISREVIEGNENGINPLGILPFVYRSKSSSTDLPFLNQLTQQSITYNVLNSDLLTSSALQGFGQLVITMPEDMVLETMHSGMTTAMTLPIIQGADTQADAKYINPNPDLAGMKETVNNYAADILSEHGIQAQGISGGNQNFSSGLERLIANADVSDQITGNQRVYTKVEQEVIDILEAYQLVRKQSEKLTVVFPKAKLMISDNETLANIKMRLDMGLITKVEALQMIDPNLDDKKAEDKLADIEKENQSRLDKFTMGDSSNADSIGQDKLRAGFNGEVKESSPLQS